MGSFGAALVPPGARVLTHCNAGSLATVGYGTAVGVIRSAFAAGRVAHVWVDETRPVLQGARLTAWELDRLGIPATLVADVMAGSLMASGDVDCVVVGADRIAANGDVANKIGTYGLAVLAAHHGIPFLVAAPRSTIDPATSSGASIVVEERSAEEVVTIGGVRIAPEGMPALNRAFDVTPASLVTAIVTEAGVAIPIAARAAGEVTEIRGLRIAPECTAVRNPSFDVTPNDLISAIVTEEGVLRAPFEASLREAMARRDARRDAAKPYPLEPAAPVGSAF
jgi:methylthioribose-1-phosphate isomerase